MNRAHVKQYKLVEKYVRQELDEAQMAEFEQFMLGDEETQAEVESLLLVAHGTALHPPAATDEGSGSNGFSIPGFGLAASVLVAGFVGYLVGEVGGASPAAVVEQSLFIPGAVRADSEVPLAGELCAERSATIHLPVPSRTNYEVRLVVGAKTYHIFGPLPAITMENGNEVGVFLRAGTLAPGDNQVALIDLTSGDRVSSGRFVVVTNC